MYCKKIVRFRQLLHNFGLHCRQRLWWQTC